MSSYQIDTLANMSKREIPNGSRLCRVVFKTTAEQKAKGIEAEESKACFLPTLSASTASAFAAQYPDIILSLVEDLQDKLVRKVWTTSRRSPCEADFTLENLAGCFEEKAERLTREALKTMWANKYHVSLINTIARLRGIPLENAENVELLKGTAQNYQEFFLWITSRKGNFWPAHVNAQIADRIIAVMAAWLEDNQDDTLIQSCVEKVLEAQFKVADESAY